MAPEEISKSVVLGCKNCTIALFFMFFPPTSHLTPRVAGGGRKKEEQQWFAICFGLDATVK